MRTFLKLFIMCIFASPIVVLAINHLVAQESTAVAEPATATEVNDRELVIKAVETFYVGDHTGSIEHKKASMHPNGAYRYVNKRGEYIESKFRLDSDNSDPSYMEELLSVEVYENVALARLRLEKIKKDPSTKVEYKLMTLHKCEGTWKVTSISWGFGITH